MESNIIKYYKEIFNTIKFVGSQPITFNHLTYNKNIPYYLTHKLDGERRLLIISNKGSFLLSNKMIFYEYPIQKSINNLIGTILDGEYYNNKFYAFDILTYKGVDIRNLILTERLVLLNEVIKSLKSPQVILKEYLSPYTNDICYNFFTLKKKYSTEMKNGIVDGIIFTPDQPYKMGIPLKWKPLELLSIDFKIRKVGNGNTIELLTQNGDVYKGSGKFKGIGTVKIPKKNYELYNNNDVIEFIFKNNKFIPIRERPDKVNSNYISVINSNFKTIINPPNMNKLLC